MDKWTPPPPTEKNKGQIKDNIQNESSLGNKLKTTEVIKHRFWG